MGSDRWVFARAGGIPFLAGAAAASAFAHALYATAVLGALVALWAAIHAGQSAARRAAPPPPPPRPPAVDPDERRRLRLLLDLSPAPLVSLDAADRLRALNRAARRLLAAEDLVPSPPPGLTEAIADTPPGRSGGVHLARDGAPHAFSLLTADLDGAGGPVRVATLVDIDADLKAAEAATLRELVQVLGHEITNNLTPIASLSATAAAMLADPASDPGEARAAVETVARRAQGLQRFGQAYRDLSRLPAPALAPVDLGVLAADLAQLFRTRWPAIPLAFAAPPSLRVHADGDQLAQAIWALLQNAAEAGAGVDVAVARMGAGARVTVADDGPGVPAEDVERIFRPFFTTKPAGTGVGLALARQIFRAHGGELRLAEGAGATFEGTIG